MLKHLISRFVTQLLLSALCVLLFWSGSAAQAGELVDRVSAFPEWHSKPSLKSADRELSFPKWIEGTWQAKSTLVDLVAPLAPEFVTPGFEGNRQYLDQPVEFTVRFVEQPIARQSFPGIVTTAQSQVIVDRAFNGLNIARAYLGNDAVLSVTLNPKSPNEQRTLLKGDRELLSITTGHNQEAPASDRFVTTELFQQMFRGTPSPYLNQVETTTDYHYQPERSPQIVADQFTAVYLSPQDPNYFKVGETPVALYRYRLELFQP